MAIIIKIIVWCCIVVTSPMPTAGRLFLRLSSSKLKRFFLQCNNFTSCELPTVYNALSGTFNLACHYCFVLLDDWQCVTVCLLIDSVTEWLTARVSVPVGWQHDRVIDSVWLYDCWLTAVSSRCCSLHSSSGSWSRDMISTVEDRHVSEHSNTLRCLWSAEPGSAAVKIFWCPLLPYGYSYKASCASLPD